MQVYEKRGRRYYPLPFWEGFPAEGVWLVARRPGVSMETCVLHAEKLAEVDETVIRRANLELLRGPLNAALGRALKAGHLTINDITGHALDELAKNPLGDAW